jgi:hypothetical protein
MIKRKNEKIAVAVVGWQWVVALERAKQGGHFGGKIKRNS